MAISTYCCLNNFPLPPSTSVSSQISTTLQVPCSPPREQRSWKKQCFLGLTCAIIGLELGNFAVVGDRETALAVDMQSGPSKEMIMISRDPMIRWSDKRACRPWRLNSLETIVPENLPRPSARRRWETTGFFSDQAAPPVKVVVESGDKGCFNM